MDTIKRKLLIVFEDNKFKGLLSIGDIQRAIISNSHFTAAISLIMRNDYIIATPEHSVEDIKKLMLSIRAEFMPVVDTYKNLVHVYFWNDLFGNIPKEPSSKFDLPIVIMAGGQGTRLKPLTNVIPKPLIPLNEKTILEDIMDSFVNHGCNNFFISVNYKADIIRYYFNQLNSPYYNINYFQEDKPLGTAGSLSLLKGKINQTFFVSNCDILIDQDYSEILSYHRNNGNEITVVAALKHIYVSYGTIKSGENGQLLELVEKPELTFMINSGMYILEPTVFSEIPDNEFFHITDLIGSLKNMNRKVGVFPVSEKSWKDIGEWKEYIDLI
jgi:dTDP-glucose pyrophosphorylase